MNSEINCANPSIIELDVRLSAETFQRFCIFDSILRKRQWLKPVLLSMTLWTVALALMLFWSTQTGSFAGLLTGLGLALPLLYFGLNYIQIKVQIHQRQLITPQNIYHLKMNEKGVYVSSAQKNENSAVILPWNQIGPAYQQKDCIYLYVNPKRALLIPNNQANVPDEVVWNFLCQMLGNQKCVGNQKNR